MIPPLIQRMQKFHIHLLIDMNYENPTKFTEKKKTAMDKKKMKLQKAN